ncbi:MAG: hypothetical protein ACLGSA_05150 [Acidobacteriota bacterium]
MPNALTAIPQSVLRYLRIQPDTHACAEALPLWREARALSQPRTWRKRLDMGDFLEAFAPHAAESVDLSRTLAGCREVVLMACTIGSALETRGREYFSQGRPFAGFMLDRMGSYLVEAEMRGLHAAVRAENAASGLVATRRYSPGYKDFSLEAQAHFIRLIGDALPGLTLSSAFMLTPDKSVTAVCGIKTPA